MTNKFLALSLLSLAAACTTSPDQGDRVSTSPGAPPPMTTELQPVASFTSFTGSKVEMYAVGEHGYFVTELSDDGVARVLEHTDDVARMNPAELYTTVTGKTDVPAAIVALDRQVLPLGDDLVSRDRRASRGTTSTAPQTSVASAGNCTATYFQAHDCPVALGSGGIGARDFCLLNWGGGAYEYAGTVDNSTANLCSSHGQVLWQISNGDGGFHQWSVLEGQFFNYYLHDSGETWLHYDVLQASGDTFQFGGDFYWY